MLKKLAFLVVIFCSSQGFAQYGGGGFSSDGFYGSGFAVDISAGFFSQTIEADGLNIENSASNIALKGGYIFSQGLYVGGKGFSEGGDLSATGFGASIGYMNSGLQIVGTYYFTSTYEINNVDPTQEFTKGSGFELEFNSLYMMTANFAAGYGIVYRQITTKEFSLGGAAAIDIETTFTEYMPQVLLAFLF